VSPAAHAGGRCSSQELFRPLFFPYSGSPFGFKRIALMRKSGQAVLDSHQYFFFLPSLHKTLVRALILLFPPPPS